MKKQQAELFGMDHEWPRLIKQAEASSTWKLSEYFAARVRHRRTSESYRRGIARFVDWCDRHGVTGLSKVEPHVISEYLASVRKPNLTVVRFLFDWLVGGKVIPWNPARFRSSPEMTSEQARQIVDLIEIAAWHVFRDRITTVH